MIKLITGDLTDQVKAKYKGYSKMSLIFEIDKIRKNTIDECIKAIEDSKSLFDNSTKWTMAEKDKLQNILEQLKESVDE